MFANYSHVIYELTNTKKLGENVGKNKGKFFLSSTVVTRVCRLFFCRSHTPTWVFQNKFANFSLTCKDRFTLLCWSLLLSCTYVVFVVVVVVVYNHSPLINVSYPRFWFYHVLSSPRWLNKLITNNSITHFVFVKCPIVNCTAGTYLNRKLGTCEDCAIGFYQEQDAQVECTKCPAGTSTTEVRTDNSSSCLGIVLNFCMRWK